MRIHARITFIEWVSVNTVASISVVRTQPSAPHHVLSLRNRFQVFVEYAPAHATQMIEP